MDVSISKNIFIIYLCVCIWRYIDIDIGIDINTTIYIYIYMCVRVFYYYILYTYYIFTCMYTTIYYCKLYIYISICFPRDFWKLLLPIGATSLSKSVGSESPWQLFMPRSSAMLWQRYQRHQKATPSKLQQVAGCCSLELPPEMVLLGIS